MAQTDFLLDEQEQRLLVTFMVDQGLRFVPAINYPSLEYEVLTEVDQIMEVISSGKLHGPFFVLSDAFSLYPLRIRPLEKDGETIHYLMPRHGGPYLDLLPSKKRRKGGTPLYISGFVGYYSYFFKEAYEKVEAGAALRGIYRSICKYLRSVCVQAATVEGHHKHLIGHSVLEELRRGAKSNLPGVVIP